MEGPLKGKLLIGLNGAKEMEDQALCLCLVDETGLEENRRCEAAGIPNFSNVGLHYLKAGDRLTIYDQSDPSAVVWSGTLPKGLGVLLQDLVWMEDEDRARPFPPPPGVEAVNWLKWFSENYPAELVPAP